MKRAKVHDATTGLDHFPARYYASALALFTTPDDGDGQAAGDPRSWDLYAYVRGNAASLTDPSGETYCKKGAEITGGRGLPSGDCISDAAYAKLKKDQKASYVQVSQDATLTISGRMPPPIPLAGGAGPGGGDPFLALATRITQLNPGGSIRDFAIQALATGAAGLLLGVLGGTGEAAELAATGEELISDPAEVAEQAVEDFLGPDKQPALDRNTGAQVGWKSADGQSYALGPHADAGGPHYNFKDLVTGSNLRVRWR